MILVSEMCTGMAVLDYFNNAIIGFDVDSNKVVYDYNLMIQVLIKEHKLDNEMAIEYISQNIIGIKISNDAGDDISPIIISKFEDIELLDDKL